MPNAPVPDKDRSRPTHGGYSAPPPLPHFSLLALLGEYLHRLHVRSGQLILHQVLRHSAQPRRRLRLAAARVESNRSYENRYESNCFHGVKRFSSHLFNHTAMTESTQKLLFSLFFSTPALVYPHNPHRESNDGISHLRRFLTNHHVRFRNSTTLSLRWNASSARRISALRIILWNDSAKQFHKVGKISSI